MIRYLPIHSSNAIGTSLQRYTPRYTFAELCRVLGAPNAKGDGCKVSTEWVLLRDEDGTVVTVYDYKETALSRHVRYAHDLPTVEQFRAGPAYEWHVGAARGAEADLFLEWLDGEVQALRKGVR